LQKQRHALDMASQSESAVFAYLFEGSPAGEAKLQSQRVLDGSQTMVL
jgi:hypothetical protein